MIHATGRDGMTVTNDEQIRILDGEICRHYDNIRFVGRQETE
jgi:hypothetical protein